MNAPADLQQQHDFMVPLETGDRHALWRHQGGQGDAPEQDDCEECNTLLNFTWGSACMSKTGGAWVCRTCRNTLAEEEADDPDAAYKQNRRLKYKAFGLTYLMLKWYQEACTQPPADLLKLWCNICLSWSGGIPNKRDRKSKEALVKTTTSVPSWP